MSNKNVPPKYEKPTFEGLPIWTPKSQRQFDFMWSDTDITVFGGKRCATLSQQCECKQ